MSAPLTVGAALGVLLTAGSIFAQSAGPDVIVGAITGPSNYTPVIGSGVSALAIGTDSCNIGNAPLRWFDYNNPNVPASSNEHPVIAQNVYRLANGRFEQIGMSWLKHGFTALANNLCMACNPPSAPPGGSSGDYLGVGCSDPYSSGLNGNQNGLGPRFEVNPFTGAYPHPFTSPPISGNARRILVQNSDFTIPGALYFGEGLYVAPDDAAAGNHYNNASWRQMTFAANAGGTGYNGSMTGLTHRMEPAIFAWKAQDPLVSLKQVDIPGDGRFWIGYRSTSLGGGQWRHAYSIYNLNSDRALQSFSLALPSGVTATNLYFHDVNHHSGEPFSGTDWTATNSGGTVSFGTTSHAVDPNSNALRWGTLFNFELEADAETIGDATLTLFKPGIPASLAVTLCEATGLPSSKQIAYGASSVAYDFVDLTGISSPGPSGATGSTLVTLPFPFVLYDRTLTQIRISVEGYLTSPEQLGTSSTNGALGSNVAPNAMIAPFWDNLSTTSGGSIVYGTVGTAPSRRFVVHWNNVFRSGTTQQENFQAILDEATHAVTYTWVATGSGGSSATVGIEDETGIVFTQSSFNTAGSVVAGTSLKLQRTVTIPQSAKLTLSGDGSFANPLKWKYVGGPFSLLLLGADVSAGPTDLGPFGVINLGLFGPTFLAVVDGTGIFSPADPSAVSNQCGVWTYSIAIGNDPLPDLDVFTQAIGVNFAAPNGEFDISTVAVIF